MTKRFGWCLLISCLLPPFLLVSCKPKPPVSRADRQKWNLATLTAGYEQSGHKNPKWDNDAQEALKEFAQTRTAPDDELEVLFDLVGGSADNAVRAGCDDPMIKYLYARYATGAGGKPFSERQDLYRAAAKALESSSYPSLRKFYANADAANILWQRADTNLWPEVRQFRFTALADLNQALHDKTLPEIEAYQAADILFLMLSRNTYELTNAYNQIAATLKAPGTKPAEADFIKAAFYQQYAWRARGNGMADQVTGEGWRLFNERLAVADKALKMAWSSDPYDPEIPTLMISVVLGQQLGRPEMEKWFQRAMKVDPNNYDACRAKLHFLLPEWYGSRDEMVEFGRECVASTNWGGKVPLILVDAHSEFDRTLDSPERAEYWAQPDVWPDIKAAYDRYSQINPDKTRFRYPFAWYAFRCGQMDDFKEQIKLIRKDDGEVRYSYFGGKDAFDKAVAQAEGRGQLTNAVPAQ